MSLRKCSKCHKDKPLTDFYVSRKRVSGYQNACKACDKITAVKWAKESGYFSTKEGKEAWVRASLKSQKLYPYKTEARILVRDAVRTGVLKRPLDCDMASISSCCYGRLHAHHHDYSRPLDVRWLCQRHHREIHEKMKESAKISHS